MEDMFLRSIRSLKKGDQFRLDETHYGWLFWEVFDVRAGNVYIFPTDTDLYREDGSMVRNMVFRYGYYRPDMKVTPLVNKRPVANRNHCQPGYPETFLNPDYGH